MALWLMLLCGLALAAAGCGAEDEAAAPAPTPRTATDLVVRLDPDGRGPQAARELQVRCAEGDTSAACAAAGRLQPAALDPAAGGLACTDIYGGPETARITGTLGGERIDVRLSRRNGCEIARWDAAAPLLELVR